MKNQQPNDRELIKKYSEEIEFLKKELSSVHEKQDALWHQIELLENLNKAKEKTLNTLLIEAQNKVRLEQEKNINSFKLETELKTKVTEWEKIIDEMAHSINTDVFISVSKLTAFSKEPQIRSALAHIKQIRDLTNLIMWSLKKEEIKISDELMEISLEEIVNEQISSILEGISTLRISSDEHEENLSKLNVPVQTHGSDKVNINIKEMSDALVLILKDLLKNALKNTDEQNPHVEVSIIEQDKNILLEIINNQAIAEEFSDWFNEKSDIEPQISKSTKVGLRIIKKWVKILNIQAELLPDKKQNKTYARVIIPKKINYGQTN